MLSKLVKYFWCHYRAAETVKRIYAERENSVASPSPPTVALLRYAYDAQAKRARQERVGTVNFWDNDLPDDLKAQLTSDEQADWREFVNDRRGSV